MELIWDLDDNAEIAVCSVNDPFSHPDLSSRCQGTEFRLCIVDNAHSVCVTLFQIHGIYNTREQALARESSSGIAMLLQYMETPLTRRSGNRRADRGLIFRHAHGPLRVGVPIANTL